MDGQTNEAHSLAQLQFLSHVEKIVCDKVAAAIKQHELEKQHILTGHQRDLDDLVGRCNDLEKLIRSGFPEGDPPSHCRVHQGYITDVADRRKRVSATLSHVINAGVIGGGILLVNAIWAYFKDHVK